MSIVKGVGNFANLANKEFLGFVSEPSRVASYEGWGSYWNEDRDVSTANNTLERILNLRKTNTQTGLSSKIFSGLRVFGSGQSMVGGFMNEGLVGAAKWGAAEWAASGIVSAAAANGVGLLGQSTIGAVGGLGGMMATGGSPLGYVAGQAIMSSMVQGGVAGTAFAYGAPILSAAVIAATGAYVAGRGSYEVMKAGYNRRQRLLTNIDTAGSTAAFFNKNAFTMRSRAIEAIRNNHFNAKSAFGNEAKRIHFQSQRKFRQGSY